MSGERECSNVSFGSECAGPNRLIIWHWRCSCGDGGVSYDQDEARAEADPHWERVTGVSRRHG